MFLSFAFILECKSADEERKMFRRKDPRGRAEDTADVVLVFFQKLITVASSVWFLRKLHLGLVSEKLKEGLKEPFHYIPKLYAQRNFNHVALETPCGVPHL